MGLHVITGKPRGGKSLYALKLVVDELKHGRRPVVGNLALNLPNLCAYLPDVDVVRRVRILPEEQLGTFYLRRGFSEETNGWVDGEAPAASAGCLAWIPQIPKDSGCLYVLDEAHLYFNAHQWATIGKDCLWYLSQHAKLGDDIIVITQNADMIAKPFRILAQDFSVMTNLAKVRVAGFAGPANFLRRTFASWPCVPGGEQETGTFRLQAKSGLPDLYNTAAGVGIHDRTQADKGVRAKGIPWWVAPVVGLVLIVGFAFAVHGGTSALLNKMFGFATPKRGAAAPVTSAAPTAAASPVPVVAAVPVLPVAERAVPVVAAALVSGPEGWLVQVGGEWCPVAKVVEAAWPARAHGLLRDGRAWRLGTVQELQQAAIVPK